MPGASQHVFETLSMRDFDNYNLRKSQYQMSRDSPWMASIHVSFVAWYMSGKDNDDDLENCGMQYVLIMDIEHPKQWP